MRVVDLNCDQCGAVVAPRRHLQAYGCGDECPFCRTGHLHLHTGQIMFGMAILGFVLTLLVGSCIPSAQAGERTYIQRNGVDVGYIERNLFFDTFVIRGMDGRERGVIAQEGGKFRVYKDGKDAGTFTPRKPLGTWEERWGDDK